MNTDIKSIHFFVGTGNLVGIVYNCYFVLHNSNCVYSSPSSHFSLSHTSSSPITAASRNGNRAHSTLFQLYLYPLPGIARACVASCTATFFCIKFSCRINFCADLHPVKTKPTNFSSIQQWGETAKFLFCENFLLYIR